MIQPAGIALGKREKADNLKEKILFSWSGGKDSAMALHELIRAGRYEVAGLLTTVSQAYNRICIHGVRASLLRQQVASLGLKLEAISLSESPSNEEYERKMEEALLRFKERGITKVGFGDIFLEDLKKYRDTNLARINMTGLYPIWKRNSAELIESFVKQGFKAVITCVDTHALPASFAGREIDGSFLKDLPGQVDPCGENGEFHSFVYAGPIFSSPIRFKKGEMHQVKQFVFRDLIPIEDDAEKPSGSGSF